MSLLEVRNLSKTFTATGGPFGTKHKVEAVRNVSFSLKQEEVLGIVGESGSGKTTVGRLILGLIPPDSGTILIQGQEHWSRLEHAKLVQMIFQDPYASLNPKLSVGSILFEAWRVAHPQDSPQGALKEVQDHLNAVGLPANILHDYPHQFSGGQRQRLVIARALLVKPKLIIADEPISSLDITTGDQILKLLVDLKKRFSLSYLFISHDLAVVSQICGRILVMKSGEIVESGPTQEVLTQPQHPYTRRLLDSVLQVPM